MGIERGCGGGDGTESGCRNLREEAAGGSKEQKGRCEQRQKRQAAGAGTHRLG